MDVRAVNEAGRSSSAYIEKAREVPSTSTGASRELSIEDKIVPLPGSEKTYSKSDLQKEIDGLNKWLQGSQKTHLKFTLHEELGEYYVQIVNEQTDEVIREIPPKKILDMVAKMYEMIGLLVDEKR